MSIEELIKKECPEGVEWKKLGEISTIKRGVRVVKKDLLLDGTYAVYQNSLTPMGFLEKSNVPANTSFVISAGAAGEIGFSKVDFWAADDCLVIIGNESLNNKYVFHYLLTQQKNIKRQVRKSAIPRLSRTVIEELEIPLPPLSVQEKIVEVLDKFTALESELQAELEARKKQYEYYRNELLNFEGKDVEIKTLGDVSDILVGNPFDSSKFVEEGVRLMRGMNIKREYLDFSEDLNRYWESEKGLERYLLEPEDIVMSMDGSLVGKSFAMVSEDHLPLLLVQRVARIRSTEADIHYLYYCICNGFFNYVNNKKTAGAIPHISQKDIANYPIPVPPKEDQLRIVSILDKFEALVNDALPKEIAARHQQYEYYRDKLLSFERKK